MKKTLLVLILFSSCKNTNKEDATFLMVRDTGHTEMLLERADSVLERHEKIKEENLKIFDSVINKYSDTDTLK